MFAPHEDLIWNVSQKNKVVGRSLGDKAGAASRCTVLIMQATQTYVAYIWSAELWEEQELLNPSK